MYSQNGGWRVTPARREKARSIMFGYAPVANDTCERVSLRDHSHVSLHDYTSITAPETPPLVKKSSYSHSADWQVAATSSPYLEPSTNENGSVYSGQSVSSSGDKVCICSVSDDFEFSDVPAADIADVMNSSDIADVVNSVGKFDHIYDPTPDITDTDNMDMLAVFESDTMENLVRIKRARIAEKKRDLTTLEQQLKDLEPLTSLSPCPANNKRRRALPMSFGNMGFKTMTIEDSGSSKIAFEVSRRKCRDMFLHRCILEERNRVYDYLCVLYDQ